MEDLKGGTLALEHRYEIEAEDGRVAQALVYRATQRPFDRPVSVRVYDVFEGSSAAEDLTARIKETCRAVSSLEHEGVLRIVDYGEIGKGLPFVVSERTRGPALSDWLESQGTLALDVVVELVVRISEIVQKAHDQGIVHGALGTHSVWVPGEDIAATHVAGFGLGLTMGELRELENAILSHDSVASLAPEFFEDEAHVPDRASDIYSVAAIAYTALAGLHPYFQDLNDTSEGLIRIKSADVRDLEEFGVDEEVSRVIMAGLAADRDERPTRIDDFAESLRRAVEPGEPEEVAGESEDELETADDETVDDSSVFDLAGEPTQTVSPTPPGTFVGLVVLGLILSNFAWVLWASSQDEGAPDQVEPGPREVLKSSLELVTQPEGARVIRTGETAEDELGRTPLMVDPSLGDGQLQLRVEKRGFQSVNLRVREADGGNEVMIELSESPE